MRVTEWPNRGMREEIQSALDVLVGKDLWASGRAADLQWFQFGQCRTVTDSRGGAKEVGEYALHVQCAWRIRKGDVVIVGSRDLYSPAEDTKDGQHFDWEIPGTSRLDKRIHSIFENETRHLLVSVVEAREAGSFTVQLENDYELDVFPHDTLPVEHWRLFRPYKDEPHFVVSGNGIDKEG